MAKILLQYSNKIKYWLTLSLVVVGWADRAEQIVAFRLTCEVSLKCMEKMNLHGPAKVKKGKK